MTRLIDSYPEIMSVFGREDVNGKLNEYLREALEALEDAPGDKAKATVTLEMNFTRDGDKISIVPSVKSKLPPAPGFRGTTCWLVDGKISVQHPSQLDMFTGPREVAPRTRDAG
jgi:hypothetical protein